MIKIGLTTWSEHPLLVLSAKPTLAEYASKLPVVEIDSSFYGIPRQTTVANWVAETPDAFKFLIKAHKTMTQHSHWQDEFPSEQELYQQFFEAMAPVIDSGQLEAFLFQFPPYFSCTEENIIYLKRIRKIFKGLPLGIEFRNGTWFDEKIRSKMVAFMREEEFILTSVDEPQVPTNSVPFITTVTNPKQGLIRLHGRNLTGWLSKGEDWRKKRTLYHYNEAELQQLAGTIQEMAMKVRDITIIFNNNSGGDAAGNALTLQKMLNIQYDGLNPEQMDLF